MKGLLFLGLIVLVLLAASIGLSKEMKKEGFVGTPQGGVNPGSNESMRAPKVIIPTVNPKPAPLEGSTPAPYLTPTDLSYGPAYGEIARINTLPYRDPTLESAPFKRISELVESLKGFFTYEAKGLQSLSDPQVQLPLTTARGDLQRLTDELAVLKRNPGIDSALTQGQVDDIQANLAYLQRKYRMSVNSVSGSSLSEGFTDGSGNEVQTDNSGNEVAATTNAVESDDRLTITELNQLKITIQAEIARLSSSGTTDAVTTARVNTLNTIKNNVETIINEVETGLRPALEIPIMKKDRDSFLPLMSDMSKPLPQLLNSANLPVSISNAFPAYGPGDKTGAMAAQALFEKYGEKIFNGLSWSLGLKFTSPNEVDVAKGSGSGSGAMKSDTPVFLTGSGLQGSNGMTFPRGEMESTTSGMEIDRLESRPTLDMGKAAKYDWRTKAASICDSIRKQGMDPNDFGCMDPSKQVSPDYSWRGNARMVCTRLLTTPDPGLPETCGCPPVEWSGWRS
jgi:hypothetical protein